MAGKHQGQPVFGSAFVVPRGRNTEIRGGAEARANLAHYRKSPNAQVKDANDVLARGGSQREQSQATLHSWKGNRQSGWNDTVFGSPRAHFDAGHQSGTIN